MAASSSLGDKLSSQKEYAKTGHKARVVVEKMKGQYGNLGPYAKN